MFQENIKKIEIKNTLSTTKKNSHPFNASDKYHVCVGSSTASSARIIRKPQASGRAWNAGQARKKAATTAVSSSWYSNAGVK